jgi:hypothetical protein
VEVEVEVESTEEGEDAEAGRRGALNENVDVEGTLVFAVVVIAVNAKDVLDADSVVVIATASPPLRP